MAEVGSHPGYTKIGSNEQDMHFFHLPIGFPGSDVTPTHGKQVLHLLALGEMLLGTPEHVEAVTGEQRLNTAFSLFQPTQIDLP